MGGNDGPDSSLQQFDSLFFVRDNVAFVKCNFETGTALFTFFNVSQEPQEVQVSPPSLLRHAMKVYQQGRDWSPQQPIDPEIKQVQVQPLSWQPQFAKDELVVVEKANEWFLAKIVQPMPIKYQYHVTFDGYDATRDDYVLEGYIRPRLSYTDKDEVWNKNTNLVVRKKQGLVAGRVFLSEYVPNTIRLLHDNGGYSDVGLDDVVAVVERSSEEW